MPFTSLLGQPQAIELLTRAVHQHRIAPAYLFVGAPGVGRRLAAREFAELLLAALPSESQQVKSQQARSQPAKSQPLRQRIQQGNHPDLLWVEPTYLHQGKRVSAAEAAELGVKRKSLPEVRLEQIREIGRFLSRPPLESMRSIVIIENAESMADSAANGLLKTLEEPGRATLILMAPSAESLLPTIVSRCQKIAFQRLDAPTLAQVLTQAGHAEILQQPDVLALAQGSPGEAIVHWQQLQAIPEDLLTAVSQPPTSLRAALDLARQIAQVLDSETQIWLIDYLQNRYWQIQAQPSILQTLEEARRYLRQYVQPRLVWEVTLARIKDAA
jgi:DNA polymerase III subunit delta'